MRRMPAASPWRRMAAFGVDYLLIVLYIGLLALFMLRLGDGPAAWVHTPWQGHLLGFVTLTLPVGLYFALSEASKAQGTLGKRLMGLSVVACSGEPASRLRSLTRSAIKFLPWEISHTMLYRIEGWPTNPAPLSTGQTIAFGLAYLLGLWFILGLFLGDRRTPYDRLAGTRVVPAARFTHPPLLMEVAS